MTNWLETAANYLGNPLSQAQIDAFDVYEKELIDWNSRFNLTAIREPEAIRTKHFLDSISCVAATGNLNGSSLVDLGTGAGFPGIPLKIIFPQLQLTLVDSVEKKLKFCQHIIDTLQLSDCEVVHARAEELGHDPHHRERYEMGIARAVAKLPVLCEYLLPLVQPGGNVIAQKGESAKAELTEAQLAIDILGGEKVFLYEVKLPELPEPRFLIKIQKGFYTPSVYPRTPARIKQEPLG